MSTKPSMSDVKRESILAALGAIAAANNGYLSPTHVVDAARDEGSPLHDEFEWDDTEAADAYRLAQAGALIRRVRFTVVRQDGDPKKVQISTARAYQSRVSARTTGGGYESVVDILADQEKREELLQQVLRELDAYRKRYAEIMALSGVWRAIDDALEILSPTPSRQGKAAQADKQRRPA